MTDPINHPAHYSNCGTHTECGKKIEVIDVTEGLSFTLGNAVKYLLRAGKKTDALEDLKKARWYINHEITRLVAGESTDDSMSERAAAAIADVVLADAELRGESTDDWRDGYEAGCDDTELSREHDSLARLAQITENAAWPLSLLSWLIRQELGEPVSVWQPPAPTPAPAHENVHLVDGSCWCNCAACTNAESDRCICPECNGASFGHEDRTAARS